MFLNTYYSRKYMCYYSHYNLLCTYDNFYNDIDMFNCSFFIWVTCCTVIIAFRITSITSLTCMSFVLLGSHIFVYKQSYHFHYIFLDLNGFYHDFPGFKLIRVGLIGYSLLFKEMYFVTKDPPKLNSNKFKHYFIL